MSYQTRKRRCRRCRKKTYHWRDLPDTPRRWSKFLKAAPKLFWRRLATGWTCRDCKGVPTGPLELGSVIDADGVRSSANGSRPSRGGRRHRSGLIKEVANAVEAGPRRGAAPRLSNGVPAGYDGAMEAEATPTIPTTAERPRPPGGRFVVLDGPDGGGKTTQVVRLADWARARGEAVVTCRDPGGTELGDRLRGHLLDRARTAPTLRAEMLLYMASRAQLVEEVIRPALARGALVISDRFLLANIVYQGYAGGLDVEAIGRVGREATGGLLPDLTLILDAPVDLAQSRIGRARDRIEERPLDYHERVRAGFLRAADLARSGGCPYYPAPMVVVDATGDPDAVAGRIRTEVERALALDPRR